MKHSNRMTPYLIGAAVLAVVMLAFGAPGISLAPLLFVLVCPLMMFFMMRGMDHNPQANHVHPPEGHSQDDPMIRH